MTPEEQLLVMSCLEPLAGAEGARFEELASSPLLGWLEVQHLAQLNKVEPRLTHALQTRGLWARVPTAVAQVLTAAAEAVAEANSKRVARAVELFAAFSNEGIEFCLLKGVLFAETLYGDPLYKRMNDIDMLVHSEDLARIVAVYQRLGYFSIADRVANRPDLNKKVSHHLPPFVSRELDCLLGTQWGLKSPLAGLDIDYPALWSRIEPQPYHGIPIHKLSSRDNLFHVCVHLGIFKSGLRDLMDIANLIRQESSRIDWPAFVADVRKSRAQTLVVHALMLVNCLDPRPETQGAIDALLPEAHGFYLEAARKKTASAAVLLRICTGHLGNVEKAVSAFNVARYFPEKSRLFGEFFRSVFLAPREDCERIVFTPKPTATEAAWARVAAPGQMLRAIGAEIGNGLLAGLFVKSAFDLTTAFARWPFASKKANDLEAYAHSLGLELADLERIKNAIY